MISDNPSPSWATTTDELTTDWELYSYKVNEENGNLEVIVTRTYHDVDEFKVLAFDVSVIDDELESFAEVDEDDIEYFIDNLMEDYDMERDAIDYADYSYLQFNEKRRKGEKLL